MNNFKHKQRFIQYYKQGEILVSSIYHSFKYKSTMSYTPISPISSRTVLHTFTSKSNLKIILASVIAISILIWTISSPSASSESFPISSISSFSSTSSKYPNVLSHLKKYKQVKSERLIQGDDDLVDFDRENIKYVYPEVLDNLYNNTDLDSVDWNKYAYVLYATSSNHMCNAMMIFAELRKFNTRAKLVLLVNNNFLEKPWEFEYEFNTLTSFSKQYDVLLKATPIKTLNEQGDSNIWISSFTKLMVFNETDYDRVIYLDSDAILLKDNLDELFFAPPAKLASVTGYWLTQERYAKQEYKKYIPANYKYHPQSAEQRQQRIDELIAKTMKPFANSKGYPTSNRVNDKINQKNFYNNLYNNLPDFKFLDEFSFTNIIMVIQPSKELFERIEESFNQRKPNEFDMDIVNFYVFKLSKCLELQTSRKPTDLETAINDIPEFLILPHQVYGALTSELNVVTDHRSFLAEPMDQPFAEQDHGLKPTDNHRAYYDLTRWDEQAEKFYPNIKYLHYSDLPIPKPWIEKKIEADYMSNRVRCANHKDFDPDNKTRTKPKATTKDCKAGAYWENAHELFEKIRMDVCSLRLKWIDGDAYALDQN